MVQFRLGNELEAEAAFLEAVRITDKSFYGVHPRAEMLLRDGLKVFEVWYPDTHPTMQSVLRYVDGD